MVFLILPSTVAQPLFLGMSALLIVGTLLWLSPDNIIVSTARRLVPERVKAQAGSALQSLRRLFDALAYLPSVVLARLQRFNAIFNPATWPVWLQAPLLLGSLLLMYAGQFKIYRNGDVFDPATGYVLFLLGLGLFLLSVNRVRFNDDAAIPIPDRVQRLRLRPLWLALSIGLGMWLTYRSIQEPQMALIGEYWVLWILSMIAFALAVLPRKAEMDHTAEPDKARLHRWEYGLLVALFLVALFIRGYNIGREPYLMDNDEAIFAAEGASYPSANFLISPFTPGFQTHPRIYMTMITLSTQLFGVNLTGARLPSVIMGALLIPALFLLGRELRDWQAGLVAALFTLGWSYQIEFSRLAMNQPADPLLGVLGFYFLLRGLRRGAALDYAVSGFMLGAAQMFYLGGRLLPVVMLAYLFFIWLREREVIKKQWRLILLIPLAAVIVTLPQNFYTLYNHNEITSRADDVVIDPQTVYDYLDQNILGSAINHQIKNSLLAFWSQPDRSGWYGRSSNLAGLVGGPLLLVGLVVSALLFWQRPKWSMPLGWAAAVVLFGTILTRHPPQYERYLPGVGAFALIIELGIATLAYAIANLIQRPHTARTLAVGIGVLACVGNLAFYALVYVPDNLEFAYVTNWMSNRVGTEMASEFDQGQQIVLLGGFKQSITNSPVVRFFMANKYYAIGLEQDTLPAILSRVDFSRPTTYFISAQRYTDFYALSKLYPRAKFFQVNLDQDNEIAFYMLRTTGV